MVNFLKNNNFKIKYLKYIFASSETLYHHQRDTIEGYLGIKIFDHYGNTERNALIMQCEQGSYHIVSEYGITELIGKNGNPVTEEGEVGEIIATGFNNYAMPFIRYRTNDLAVYTTKNCTCRRNYPLLNKIEGRKQDFFVDKSGSLITFTCSDGAVWDVKEKINTYQYIQHEPGKVILAIDVKRKFSSIDIESVKSRFLEYYSGFELEIKFVEHIPRTKSGKFIFLIQKLPIEFGDN